MILFIDTETTGKFNFKADVAHPSQPRIVQLAACMADDVLSAPSASFVALICPNRWEIPKEASDIHGHTTEDCQKGGIPILAALGTLYEMANRCSRVVAHNLDFDYAMIDSESYRSDCANPLQGLEKYCTMKSATGICKLPGRYGDFKWPTLAETHRHFFGSEPEDAHDAMGDVLTCMKCYYQIQSIGKK
jgi:DNA polymerase III epsilon subunit-like protein